MSDLPHTGQTEWASEQASPWLAVNKALRGLDGFAVRINVVTRSLTAPPASCADGGRYLVGAAATGLWDTYDGAVAIAKGVNAAAGWIFVPAASIEQEGNVIYLCDEGKVMRRLDSAWEEGDEVIVDTTGAADGSSVKWDLSNGRFYLG